jgi:hypothetical protein
MVLGLFFAVPNAHAVNGISGQDCLKQKTGLNNPSCTANDVRITEVEVLTPGFIGCELGETISLDIIATIESGPERYDIGIWINETGGSAKDDPVGTCFRDYLEPNAITNATCSSYGAEPDGEGTGYYDGDGDSCGDLDAEGSAPCGIARTSPLIETAPCSTIGGNCLISYRTLNVTITCADNNDDGFADFDSCSSWDNNDQTTCIGVLDTDPNTGSKCYCSILDLPIIVEPCEDVDCSPFDDVCGTYECDPNGEIGNCDIFNPFPATTICNPGSGDLCDPDESCDGSNPGCPTDTIAPATTICRPGSGDVCDPDESCTGVADAACPADVVASPTTICNPGSGDICDPAESCTGTPGAACPADIIAPATTTCRTGSGDLCDPDESCTGVADAACPADVVAPATTVCNPGSGDICDPDESCTGTPGAACPADTIAPATTTCRTGSGDLCDPDESCTGVADAACPADVVAPATTVCNPGSGDICDPDESCTGTPGYYCSGDNDLPDRFRRPLRSR